MLIGWWNFSIKQSFIKPICSDWCDLKWRTVKHILRDRSSLSFSSLIKRKGLMLEGISSLGGSFYQFRLLSLCRVEMLFLALASAKIGHLNWIEYNDSWALKSTLEEGWKANPFLDCHSWLSPSTSYLLHVLQIWGLDAFEFGLPKLRQNLIWMRSSNWIKSLSFLTLA